MTDPIYVQWANDLLSYLQTLMPGNFVTPQNVSNVAGWAQQEGGWLHNTALYNPLNTSYKTNDSVPYQPGAAVQSYSSYQEGIQATADTLAYSDPSYGYSQIINALASGGVPPNQFGSIVAGTSWNPGGGAAYANAIASNAGGSGTVLASDLIPSSPPFESTGSQQFWNEFAALAQPPTPPAPPAQSTGPQSFWNTFAALNQYYTTYGVNAPNPLATGANAVTIGNASGGSKSPTTILGGLNDALNKDQGANLLTSPGSVFTQIGARGGLALLFLIIAAVGVFMFAQGPVRGATAIASPVRQITRQRTTTRLRQARETRLTTAAGERSRERASREQRLSSRESRLGAAETREAQVHTLRLRRQLDQIRTAEESGRLTRAQAREQRARVNARIKRMKTSA